MLILEVKPKFFLKRPSKQDRFRRAIYNLLNYSGSDKDNRVAMAWFEYFILLCVVINLFVLAAPSLGSDPQYLDILEIANIVLLGVFTIELILKWCVYCNNFFREFWNYFDFVVVLGSIISLAMKYVLQE